jgi:hypothetical protein
MSNMALQILVGTALTDGRFCEGLLNGSRHILLTDFDLTDEERQAILGISAASIQEFAARLSEWLEARQSPGPRPCESGASLHPPLRASVGFLFPSDRTWSCVDSTSG